MPAFDVECPRCGYSLLYREIRGHGNVAGADDAFDELCEENRAKLAAKGEGLDWPLDCPVFRRAFDPASDRGARNARGS
ncbi:MAG TPA: hypothetical protein VNB06_14065 [Thermoanaerobaculia bacterium]|nr:hypothetical protein [Thermoanaerobaculia bacterium]